MLETDTTSNTIQLKEQELVSTSTGESIVSAVEVELFYVDISSSNWISSLQPIIFLLVSDSSNLVSTKESAYVSLISTSNTAYLIPDIPLGLQTYSNNIINFTGTAQIEAIYGSIVNIVQSTGGDGEEDMPNPLIEPKRLKQILSRITLDALTIHPGGILLYPTEPQTALIDSVTINYDAFLNVLRCKTYIVSLPQVEIPIPDPTSTTADVNAIALQLVNSPKCNLLFTLRKDTVVIESIEVSVYNSTVVQQLDLIPYLSDLVFYGMQHGVSLYVQVIDVGWGIIGINDYIDIQGSAVEEASAFVRKDYSVINLIQ